MILRDWPCRRPCADTPSPDRAPRSRRSGPAWSRSRWRSAERRAAWPWRRRKPRRRSRRRWRGGFWRLDFWIGRLRWTGRRGVCLRRRRWFDWWRGWGRRMRRRGVWREWSLCLRRPSLPLETSSLHSRRRKRNEVFGRELRGVVLLM